MSSKEDKILEYYVSCIRAGSKTLSDIDDGRIRLEVKNQIQDMVIKGTADDKSMKALGEWMNSKGINNIEGASDEINAKMASLINDIKNA